MASRITLLLVSVFWLAMMALLWRSEFGHHKPFGSTVPAGMVWSRVLAAPDASMLEIRRGTNQIGHCQVRADVGQELATGAIVEDSEEGLEGMIQHLAYYRLDVDGSVAIADLPHRAKFNFMVKLDTNQVWQQFSLKVNLRPDVYEISGDAAQQLVHVKVDAGGEVFDRSFGLADMQNPQRLLAELGGPALPLMLGMIGPRAVTGGGTNMFAAIALKWEAHSDKLLFGRHAIRAYKLKGTLFERFHANIYVSPVGEILRVELPEHIVLINNAVSSLRRAE